MEPHHHRTLGSFIQGLGPNIQVLAILIFGPVAVRNTNLPPGSFPVKHRAHEAVGMGVIHPPILPGRERFRHLEPLGFSVGNTVESVSAIHLKAPHFTRNSFHNGCI